MAKDSKDDLISFLKMVALLYIERLPASQGCGKQQKTLLLVREYEAEPEGKRELSKGNGQGARKKLLRRRKQKRKLRPSNGRQSRKVPML